MEQLSVMKEQHSVNVYRRRREQTRCIASYLKGSNTRSLSAHSIKQQSCMAESLDERKVSYDSNVMTEGTGLR